MQMVCESDKVVVTDRCGRQITDVWLWKATEKVQWQLRNVNLPNSGNDSVELQQKCCYL